MRSRQPFRLLLILALSLASLLPCAQAQGVSEYDLKAMLFYRLAQFVYWPSGGAVSGTPVLCIAGSHPFAGSLEQLAGTGGAGVRPVTRDLEGCNLLFVAASEAAGLDRWLQRASEYPVVTVSDLPGFARRGGMVELALEDERVVMVVNRTATRGQGLDFNVQLLRLARVLE